MPDIATVRTQVAPVPSQTPLIATDVVAFVAGRPVVPMATVAPQLMPVASNVAPITAPIAPVSAAINSVMPQVPPVAGPVRTQGKGRS